MMRNALASLVLVAALSPGVAAASCQPSPGGAYSYTLRLSPRAGIQCLYLVQVYEGGACEPTQHRWTLEGRCNETDRLAISDRGRLVSILAPRASHPDWAIVRVFWREGEEIREGSIPLSALSSARRPRLSFANGTLRIAEREVPFAEVPFAEVPFAEVEALAEARARRRRTR